MQDEGIGPYLKELEHLKFPPTTKNATADKFVTKNKRSDIKWCWGHCNKTKTII